MAYYLLVRYYSNKGYILDNPHYYSGGVTSYSSVTASSSSSYKYFKTNSTRTNQTSTVIKGATTSNGTYGNVGNRYTASSTGTVCNLTDVSTFGLTRDGYHIDADQAYKSSDGTKVYGQNGSSAPSAYRATISRLGGSTSANKTVSIYVNWLGNSYTVRFNASGGSGSMSDQTDFVFGTGKALSTNTFTKTGYTFAGWSKSLGSTINVWGARDEAADYANAIGTDGTYLYLKQNSGPTYFRITVDGSDTYTNLGSTAPSGVSSWVQATSSSNTITFQNSQYYYNNGWNDNHDWCDVYRVDGEQTVDYTDGASMSDAGGQIPVEAGTTVVNLYAVWTPNTYYVLLGDNAADGTGTGITTLTMTYGTTNNNSVTLPVKFGYTFGGYEDEVGDLIYDSSGNAVSGDYWTSNGTWKYTDIAIVYAIWTPKAKSFKLDPNGGTYNNTTGTTTKTVTYRTSENSSVGVPTRAGYRFDGWYYSTGNSQQIFDSAGNAISDVLNGPWYNASPTSLASGARYIHYGDYIWGAYADSSGRHLCLWDGEEWAEKIIDSNHTSIGSYPMGMGNLILLTSGEAQGDMQTDAAANTDVWDGGHITTPTILYAYVRFGNIPFNSSSTVLPDKGKIWLYDNSTTPVPTYYAHWTPKIYVKQNGNWVDGSPRINVNGTWKEPTSAYVKVNGTWKWIY